MVWMAPAPGVALRHDWDVIVAMKAEMTAQLVTDALIVGICRFRPKTSPPRPWTRHRRARPLLIFTRARRQPDIRCRDLGGDRRGNQGTQRRHPQYVRVGGRSRDPMQIQSTACLLRSFNDGHANCSRWAKAPDHGLGKYRLRGMSALVIESA